MEINGVHVDSPKLPGVEVEDWSEPDMIEAPNIRIRGTDIVFQVAEINFAARYVTFIIPESAEFKFEDDKGEIKTYKAGQLCMKSFDDILIE